MSAYLVSKQNIDVLVSGLILHDVWIPTTNKLAKEMDPDVLGRVLWAENVASLIYRYRDDMSDYMFVPEYKFSGVPNLTPGMIAKIMHCYEYQSCEHPTWEQSDAYKIITALAHELLKSLPGYNEAPWGMAA